MTRQKHERCYAPGSHGSKKPNIPSLNAELKGDRSIAENKRGEEKTHKIRAALLRVGWAVNPWQD